NMKRTLVLTAALLALIVCDVPARCEPPASGARSWLPLRLCQSWLCRDCCCPDDYCRKSLPPVPCGVCGCYPDDYCAKPLPPVPCGAPCGCADDYQRKCCPIYLGPCCQPWYTCSSGEECCAGGGNRR